MRAGRSLHWILSMMSAVAWLLSYLGVKYTGYSNPSLLEVLFLCAILFCGLFTTLFLRWKTGLPLGIFIGSLYCFAYASWLGNRWDNYFQLGYDVSFVAQILAVTSGIYLFYSWLIKK